MPQIMERGKLRNSTLQCTSLLSSLVEVSTSTVCRILHQNFQGKASQGFALSEKLLLTQKLAAMLIVEGFVSQS